MARVPCGLPGPEHGRVLGCAKLAEAVGGGACGRIVIVVCGDVGQLAGAFVVRDGCADLGSAKILKNLVPVESDLAVSRDLDISDASGASHPTDGGDGGLQPGCEFGFVDEFLAGRGGGGVL